MLHLVVVNKKRKEKKRKEKKRNINNDLANLPSHDTHLHLFLLSLLLFLFPLVSSFHI